MNSRDRSAVSLASSPQQFLMMLNAAAAAAALEDSPSRALTALPDSHQQSRGQLVLCTGTAPADSCGSAADRPRAASRSVTIAPGEISRAYMPSMSARLLTHSNSTLLRDSSSSTSSARSSRTGTGTAAGPGTGSSSTITPAYSLSRNASFANVSGSFSARAGIIRA